MRSAKRLRTILWHFRHGGAQAVGTWHQRQRAERKGESVRARRSKALLRRFRGRTRLVFNEAIPPKNEPRRNVRVAVLLDQFSALAFSYEWHSLEITPSSWRTVLERDKPDLLFVESAWNGNDGAWQYHLTGSSGPSSVFREMVSACKDKHIPTVFWNKEDPPHYSDFLPAARLFDHVLTSDSNLLERYRSDLGHDRVTAMTFAAQPAIHNPTRTQSGWRTRDIAFAGMYFAHKYPERRHQMDMLLGAAAAVSEKTEHDLDIFSRQFGGPVEYQFPPPLDQYVAGALSYPQMLTAYKSYKVFLNVNSVVDSPTMCARRIFEISACGTPVLSTASEALRAIFSTSEVAVANEAEEAQQAIMALIRQPELADRQVHLAQRRIWASHTYSHRAEQVFAVAASELVQPVSLPAVSVIVSTIRPSQLAHVFKTVGSQNEIAAELVLLTHGFAADAAELKRLQSLYSVQSLVSLEAPVDYSLGACLNLCVAAASGSILTKMDDDDFYGDNYLLDQVNALAYSAADVVGKQSHYMYLLSKNATLLRFPEREHRYTDRVMGPTIMARKETFREVPFEPLTRGEDTAFLRTVTGAGATIYSADRFNYCQQRNGTGHTWQATDAELLTTGTIKFFGRPDEHVSL